MERPDLKQALGRLLGPAGPEVGCDECFEHLDRYVELELAGQDADAAIPGLRAHLEGCPACCDEHASLRRARGRRAAALANVREQRAAAARNDDRPLGSAQHAARDATAEPAPA